MIRIYTGTHSKLLPARYLSLNSFPLFHYSPFRRFSSMSVQQPSWSIPKKEREEPVLRLYNSLTRTKVSSVNYLRVINSHINQSID